MTEIFIDAIGIAAPGLVTWKASQSILRDETAYASEPLPAYAPSMLPANEQRRATATVRLAFRVAEEAIHNGSVTASTLATVFASSDADMMVSHRICSALSQTQRLVSPTDFHNSVHNAPSGYWHIGAKSKLPSSAVAGHDYSFAVGLIEAITQVQTDTQNTLLVCYDVPAPEPLLQKRPLTDSFAVALLLSPVRTLTSIAAIRIESLNVDATPTTLQHMALERLRLGNPAARSLPLLQSLARQQSGVLVLKRSEDQTLSLQTSML
jgi:hypothetical protein